MFESYKKCFLTTIKTMLTCLVTYKHKVGFNVSANNNWLFQAATRENVLSDMCAQRRLISACACAQSDHSLRCPHEENLHHWLSKQNTKNAPSEDSDQTTRMRMLISIFVGILSIYRFRRIINKLNIKLFGLFSVFDSPPEFKIHNNKIHSYNKIIVIIFLVTRMTLTCLLADFQNAMWLAVLWARHLHALLPGNFKQWNLATDSGMKTTFMKQDLRKVCWKSC